MLEQTLHVPVHVQFRPTGRTERAVRSDSNLVVLAQLEQRLLRQVRVDLDLVHLRVVLGVAQDIVQQRTVDVRYADVLGQAGVDELLHGAPGLLEGDVAHGVAFLVEAEPTWWEPGGDGDVLEGAGEVDEEQVEVVDAPEGELVLAVPNAVDPEEVGELALPEPVLERTVLDGAGLLDTTDAVPFVALESSVPFCAHFWQGLIQPRQL